MACDCGVAPLSVPLVRMKMSASHTVNTDANKRKRDDDSEATGPAFPFDAGSPCLWLAPMVGQSETAFRMLCRQYGTTLTTTPMIDPAGYVRSESYRTEFEFFPEDRPLVVQFGGGFCFFALAFHDDDVWFCVLSLDAQLPMSISPSLQGVAWTILWLLRGWSLLIATQ